MMNESAISPSPKGSSFDKSFHLIRRLKKIPGIGIFLGALSGVLFAFSTLMVKVLDNINPFEILAYRSAIQMVIYLLIILYKGDAILGAPGERIWMIIVNLFGFLFLGLAYIAIRMISLGDSSAIIFSSSVYASVFAKFVLNEACGLLNTFCVALVICGVILIARPDFIFGTTGGVYSYSDSDRFIGLGLSFISSLSAALTYVLMRKLRKTSTSVEMFWFSLVDAVMALFIAAMLRGFTFPETTKEWVLLTANGFFGAGGLLLLGLALKLEEAGPVSLARTIDIVMAFILQVIILHDSPSWTSILGAIIILTGVAVSAMRKMIENKINSLKSKKRQTNVIATIDITQSTD